MLKELEQQEKELLESLGKVRCSIRNEKWRIAEQDFGVRIGSIIKDRNGVVYRVIEVSTRFDGKPWLVGNPKKKDGSFGIAQRNIYSDWELVST